MQRSAAWFQVSLKSLFLFTLVVASFFAGWSIADRQADQDVREAQKAAGLARREAQVRQSEIDRELADRAGRTIPCHPGCFPAGTLVRVPRGMVPIEQIGKGDPVLIVGADGQPSVGKVVGVFATRNRLVSVQTDSGALETTHTQPVCLETGELRAAGALRPGDTIWRWDGAGRKATTVRGVTPARIAQVFNLVLGEPTVFIAGDFLVRSKPPPEPSAEAE